MTYTSDVAKIHKRYAAALKKAGSARTAKAAYAAHKKAHARLLKAHLRDEESKLKKVCKRLS